mmetsp:Transcript_27362/g.51886  ORF Transcript_27362/g.51886 Transcript_27362/m.51886 type:complete len:297 (+) Transcript_27362:367-1257(+)
MVVDVRERDAGVREGTGDRKGGGGGEVLGGLFRIAEAENARNGSKAKSSGVLLAHHDHARSTVVQRGSVRGSHSSILPLKRSSQTAHLVDIEVPGLGVLADDSVAPPALDSDVADLIFELSGLDGGVCPPVALNSVSVLILSGDAVVLGALLAAHAHVLVVVHVPEAVLDDAVLNLAGAKLHASAHGRQVVRDLAHALKATSKLRARSKHDVLGRIHRRLHPARADLVDGGALPSVVPPSALPSLASGGLPNARAHDVAQGDVNNGLSGELSGGGFRERRELGRNRGRREGGRSNR